MTTTRIDAPTITAAADLAGFKTKRQAMWASGEVADPDAGGQSAFQTNLLAPVRSAGRGGAAGLLVAADYRETVITR